MMSAAGSSINILLSFTMYPQVFEAFEQVDMSTTRKYGGTGLGLNLVKQLVDAHGGTIHVKSKQGVGTRFSFTLKVCSRLCCVSIYTPV